MFRESIGSAAGLFLRLSCTTRDPDTYEKLLGSPRFLLHYAFRIPNLVRCEQMVADLGDYEKAVEKDPREVRISEDTSSLDN